MIEIFRFMEVAVKNGNQKKEEKKYVFFLVGLILTMGVVPAIIYLLRKDTSEVYLEMLCADLMIFLLGVVTGITVFALRTQKKQELWSPRSMAYVIYNEQLFEVYVFVYTYNYKHGHGGNPYDFVEKNELLRKQFEDPVFLAELLEKYIAGEELPERFTVKKLSPITKVQLNKQGDCLIMETSVGTKKVFDRLERFSYFVQRIREIG